MRADPGRSGPSATQRTSGLLAFRRCGLTPDEAARWAAVGIGPYDAEAATSIGLSPSDPAVAGAAAGSTLPAKAGWVVVRSDLGSGDDWTRWGQGHQRATITVSEIAELAGARRSIVSHWRKGKRGFPEPLIGGRSPQYDLAAVLRWMDGNGKLVNPPDALWHWKRQVRSLPMALGGVDRSSLRGLVAALVATVSMAEDVSALFGTSSLGRGFRRVAAQVEAARPAWKGGLLPLVGNVESGALAAPLPELVRLLSSAMSEGCPPAGVLDEGLDALNASGPSRTVTDVELAELLVGLLGTEPGERVLDPACGEGQLLTRLAVHGRRSVHLTGVELDPVAAGIARTRLLLRGLDAAVTTRDALQMRFDGVFDRVIIDPPLQERSAPAHLWLRLASRHVRRAGRGVVVAAVPSLGPNSAALRVVADHGGAAIVPSGPAMRTDARTGLVVCVLPGRDLVRGRALITSPVGQTRRSSGPEARGRSRPPASQLAVDRWLQRDSGSKADVQRGSLVVDVAELVEAGVEPFIAPAVAVPGSERVLAAARRLAEELESTPHDTAADDLRAALDRFLAGTGDT